MIHQITNGFKQMPDNDLISFGYDVKTGMTANPVFTEPPAALGTLEKVLPEYQGAITSARGGDEEMRFIRNAKRAEVIALLTGDVFQRCGSINKYKAYTMLKQSATMVSKISPWP